MFLLPHKAGPSLTVIDDARSGHLHGAQLALVLDLALATVLLAQTASEGGAAGSTAASALEQTAGVTGLDTGDAVAAHACLAREETTDRDV